MRTWPLRLLLQRLDGHAGFPITQNVILLKEKDSTLPPPENCRLESFVDYTLLAMEKPSPLIDEWVDKFLKHPVESLNRELSHSLEADTFHHDYMKWLLKDREGGFPNENLEQWQIKAREIFGSAFPIKTKGKKS